jgi:hypothetical protein
VRSGADATSDHHLLTTRLKLKLKRTDRQTAGRTIYNVNLLKEQKTQIAFSVSQKNRFQVLQEPMTPKDNFTKTCHEVLGPKKK